MKGMSSVCSSDEDTCRQEDKQSKRNKRKRAKKNLLWPWEKDPGDTKQDVTLWDNFSPHVSVVVPTDPWMRGFALEGVQESTTSPVAVIRSCALH